MHRSGLFALSLSALALAGCPGASEDLCGPCGSIATGQLSISGNARLDGFFTAVSQLGKANARVRGDFEADIKALAAVYGMAEGEVNAQFVDDLVATIKADFDAHLQGGIKIVMKPAECKASVDVSIEAQAQCEVAADCEVEVDPGEVSVACEGSCSGGCSGSCSGDLSCAITAPTVDCEGMCEGSCELSAAASCEGTCHGQCDAGCSATDASGECHGTCEGMCMGTCEIAAEASCTGTCHGTCKVDQGSAQCTGEVECRGSCDAECSGSCEGNFEPPSASADCEASADCSAQAKAQAQASVECTPPSIDIDIEFQGGISATAQAEFLARLGELKVRGAAILQGFARLQALVTGEVNGEVVFDPSPVVAVTGEMEGLISAGVEGDFEIPAGRIACVIPAFEEAVDTLATVGTEATATLEAQASFAAVFTGG
jgi:hypothetical protein